MTREESLPRDEALQEIHERISKLPELRILFGIEQSIPATIVKRKVLDIISSYLQ